MNSFFAQLLLKMQARILEKVPEIKWIDQDLGQLEGYEDRPAVLWPCCLIDFNATTYDQMQGYSQFASNIFRLRLGFPPFQSANHLAPQKSKELSLAYYEIEQKLYVAIQGWDADGLMQPATRIRVVTENREDDTIRVRSLEFSTTFEDESAKPEMNTSTRPDLDFEGLMDLLNQS